MALEASRSEDTRLGVLLLAYGSPSSLADVEEYLTDIRGGRKPSIVDVQDLQNRYGMIGGRSPLLNITMAQASALRKNLEGFGGDIPVYVGMKHWYPFIHETVSRICEDGIQRLISLALAPHYSKISVGGYEETLRHAAEECVAKIDIRFIRSWHRHPLYIDALVRRVVNALSRYFPSLERSQIPIVFTAHSLPERILSEGDPYQDQLLETCEALAFKLGRPSWTLAYQSASKTGERWLRPSIIETLTSLRRKGETHVLIVPVGFVSDHLEILYDIDVQARSHAERLAIEMRRTESLNDDPTFIRCLASLVQDHIKS